jgi:hypothetical protein
VELRENRTELERLLADVWEYEDGGHKKTSLPKWLFALTLTGAVLCTSSPSDVVVPVMTALAPAQETLSVDNVSSENVAEDLDYRIARHAESLVGWRAFLEAHPDGPHAQAARAEIDGLQSARSPQPEQSPTQTPDDTAHEMASPATPPVMDEKGPAPPPQPVEVGEQSPPSRTATQTPVNAAQSPAPPVVADEEPAPPVEVAEQFPPSSAGTQAPVEAAQSPAALAVMAEAEPAPPPQPVGVAANAPLPPSRPREIAAAKSVEPAHNSHSRAERHQVSQPNVLTILVAQLLRRHGQRSDVTGGQR